MANRRNNFIKKLMQEKRLWSLLPFFVFGSWLAVSLIYEMQDDIVLFNDRAAQIIGVDSLHNGLCSAFYLDGSGQILGLADNGLDQGNLENLPLDLRRTPGNKEKVIAIQPVHANASPIDSSGHGTHMAGILVGSGAASDGKYAGIAPGASLYFQSLRNAHGTVSIEQDVSRLFQAAFSAGVRIHVNGWGEIENQYGRRTASIDRFMDQHPQFLAVFSAGNGGCEKPSLTTEANSKNALVMGSSQSARPTLSADAADTDFVSKTSSAGPAADGRIKPDLLAPSSSVVSVASSLVKSNFPADPQYHVMGGSSMAAAVAGGSAALLTQYLQYENVNIQPSSALLKTLMIQGARKTNSDTGQYGFGILDMATTILSLQHHLMLWEDQAAALKKSEARDYYYTVEDTTRPLRATLSWLDPVSDGNSVKQLVNNLDLQVISPDGRIYYGNDFSGRGIQDQVNNVEQVVIENPVMGTYTLRVEYTGSQKGEEQSYAVAYGQNIVSDVIQSADKEKIILASGRLVHLGGKNTTFYHQGHPYSGMDKMMPGSQVYWFKDTFYVLSYDWTEQGIQILADDKGILMTSIHSLARHGGYYIEPKWLKNQHGTVLYNGEERPVQQIPDGVGVQASINPVSQTLYQLEVRGTEMHGQIGRIDMENGFLFLQEDPEPYKIAAETAVCYINTQVEGAPEARPFGYMDRPSVEQLVPGMRVQLLLDEKTRQVYMIEAERPTVFSQIEILDEENRTLTLTQGQMYYLTPETLAVHDGQHFPVEQLLPGQWVAGITRETENHRQELVSLQLMDQIVWGKILYFGESSQTVYLLDQNNQFQDFKLAENSLIMRGRAEIRADAVSEGSWVRAVLNDRTHQIERLDIASGVREETAVVAEYSPEQKYLRFMDDAQYFVYDTTLFVREGKVVSPENLLPGETVQITVLPGSSRSDMYLARVEAEPNPGQNHLLSSLEAHYLEDKVVLVGRSLGTSIQIYRAGYDMKPVQLEQPGAFAVLLEQHEQEESFVVSAQDIVSGEVDLQKVDIKHLDNQAFAASQGFNDIAGCFYREEILNLKDRGLLSGYADGSFRPSEPITRMSFLSLLAAATGEIQISLEGVGDFKDTEKIPWWGLTTVSTLAQRGWVHGFEDGYIHPQDYMRIRDVQNLLLNCEHGRQVKLPPVQGVYVTRAEAAAIVYRLLQLQ